MIDQEIARRMDAYRGNPQALMQRYQQSQQLIDLLALQKLKSEKEAAVRSMQMAAGQQQPPTVAQQREQEVLGLTQQEVAQQVGIAAQQRAAKEREAMQRLMGGIAAAPRAENVMPEKAMAAGGIVAFQAGGMPQRDETLNERIARQQREKGGIFSTGFGLSPEDRAVLGNPDLVNQLIEQMTLQELQEFNRSGRRVIPDRLRQSVRPAYPPRAPEPVERPLAGTMTPEVEATVPPAEPTPTPVDYPPYPLRGPMRDSASTPQGSTASSTSTPATTSLSEEEEETPSRPGTPQAGLPAALPRAPDDLRSALMAMLKPDVAAMMKERRDLIPGVNAERLAARQNAINERQRMYEQEFDPKRQAMEKLIAFLTAGGGRTSTAGALGAGAQGYAQASAAQRAAQRERLKEIEGMREGVRSLEETRELEKAKAGLGALEAAQAGQRIATSGLTGLTSAELQAQTSRENAQLQAETSRLNEQARALDRALSRKDLDFRAAQQQYSILTTRLGQLREKAEKRLDDAKPMNIKVIEAKPKRTPEDEQALRIYQRARDTAIDSALQDTTSAIAAIEQKLKIPSTTRGATSSSLNLPSASAIEAELRRREGK